MERVWAESHDKSFTHRESFEENKEIFQELIRFLYVQDATPIVAIPSSTPEYNQFVLSEMKAAVPVLLDYVAEDVHYIDVNHGELFDPEDFMDIDRLSRPGHREGQRYPSGVVRNLKVRIRGSGVSTPGPSH